MSYSAFIQSVDDWIMVQDPTSQKMYYINLKTNQTRWTQPQAKPQPSSHVSHKSFVSNDTKYNQMFTAHKNDINEWIMLQDPVSGKMYYSNLNTKETKWTLPKIEPQRTDLQPLNLLIDDNQSDDDTYDSDNDVLLTDHITLGSPSAVIDGDKLDTGYNCNNDKADTCSSTDDDENIDMEQKETGYDYEDILHEMNDDDIILQLLQFGYDRKQVVCALHSIQKKHLIYDINNVLEQIQCNDMNEFTITFNSKPFGMKIAPKKNNKHNLFVREIENNSFAQKQHINIGAKLIAINGEYIEDNGSQKIFKCLKDAVLPVSIVFRKK